MRFYKYCPWQFGRNRYIRDNLRQSVLYFSDPRSFNDPFECLGGAWRRPEETHESQGRPVEGGWQGRMEEQGGESRHWPGVCCFTTKADNVLMWAHYADEHQGICLQFDFPDGIDIVRFHSGRIGDTPDRREVLFPRQVRYCQERPDFSRALGNDHERIVAYMLTKSADWEYEQEFRAISLGHRGTAYYDPHRLTGIIAGCRMGREDLRDLRIYSRHMQYVPALYQIQPKAREYGLDILPLPGEDKIKNILFYHT